WADLMGDAFYGVKGLIAIADGAPAGLVHYLRHRHAWRTGHVTYLQDLYVNQSIRGQGLGRALIEAVYRESDKADAPLVYWTTEHDNEKGRQLYDRVATLTKFIKYQRQL
ncbi:MAG: GNAT family N-acetyltransferase, partial [Pseudomonadota bacterium]